MTRIFPLGISHRNVTFTGNRFHLYLSIIKTNAGNLPVIIVKKLSYTDLKQHISESK